MKETLHTNSQLEHPLIREIDTTIKVTQDGVFPLTEFVAVEVPMDISFNGSYYAAASLSPTDLDDYAYGYALTAGVIENYNDIARVEYSFDCGRIDLSITLKEKSKRAKRASLVLTQPAEKLKPAAIWHVSESLVSLQKLYAQTGATHAAVFANFNGEVEFLREDVGRHNVVDKLIGALMRAKVNPCTGFVFLSSRCALELVQKCARYGICIVATVSAPTSAVLDFAEREGITLCAFCRGKRFTIYTHPEHLCLE